MNILLRVVSMNFDYRFAGVKLLSVEAWLGVLLLVVMAYHGSIFSRKRLYPVYLFAAIVMLMDLLGHLHGSAVVWPAAHVRPILVGTILFEIYVVGFDKYSTRVLALALFFVFVSLVLNVIGLYRYPMAVREIVGGSAGADVAQSYAKMGIEGYGFFSGLPPLIPALVYAAKKCAGLKRIAILIMITVSIIAIILSTVTTPLILAFFGLIGALTIGSMMNKFQALGILIVIAVVLISVGPNRLLRSAIPVLITISPSEEVALRLRDVDYALSGAFDVDSTSENVTSFEARFQRVYWNLETFSKNPLFGASALNESASFHLYWLYLFASFGLVGTIPFIYYIVKTARFMLDNLDKEAGAYYLLSLAVFIMMGMTKNITGWFMYLVPFFIVPGLIKWQYQESKTITEKQASIIRQS